MVKGTITTSLPELASAIDHALLHPTMTEADIDAGIALAEKYQVATACVPTSWVALASATLEDSEVRICSVVGFPHGTSNSTVKLQEADYAIVSGAHEIDMVVNIGSVLGGDWAFVEGEINSINHHVKGGGNILKVIIETDYLAEHEDAIVKLCKICAKLEVAFVKTSTGFGFVKQAAGGYNYKGATAEHIKLMKKALTDVGDDKVHIKASGGIRTLDDMLYFMSLGATRIGTSATAALLDEAKRRGIGKDPVTVEFDVPDMSESNGAY